MIQRIHFHNVKPLKVLYSVTQQFVFFTSVVLHSVTHHNNLEDHPNPLLEPLLQPINTRKLKRCWPYTYKTPNMTSLDEYPTTSL